jgi:mono/diheme cytochrome c family protein
MPTSWGRGSWLAAILVAAACGDEATGSQPDAGPDAPSAEVVRGKYLVDNVAACGNCHTPYVNGVPDTTRYLAGVVDRHLLADGTTVHSANLTSDATGLGGWTDEEIKRSLVEGIRKDGKVMWYQMPYYELANLNESDLDAMVAYLRTVPPVQHAITRREYTARTTPYLPISGSMVPQSTLPAGHARYQSAQKGRYLASFACLHCHTRDAAAGGDFRKDVASIFAGGQRFPMRPPGVPQEVFSANLTPHENGMADGTPETVKEAIKNSGALLCAPMATISRAYLSGMTDEDAVAIGDYLVSLPPVDTGVIATCTPP